MESKHLFKDFEPKLLKTSGDPCWRETSLVGGQDLGNIGGCAGCLHKVRLHKGALPLEGLSLHLHNMVFVQSVFRM